MATASNPADLLAAAWAAFAQNDPQAAQVLCRQALALDPLHVESLGAMGFFLHSARRYADAEEVFATLTDLQPLEPEHWMNLGTARRCAGRPEEALSAYTEAASRGADSADFLFNIGLAHIDRKDYESGRAVLANAVALAPDDGEIRYQYALCCYERVRTEEALSALHHWDNLSGLTPELTANIGLLLMKLGAPELAEPAVRQAVADAPLEPQPLLTLVQLLERTNRLDEAAARMAQLSGNAQAHTLGAELTLIRAQLAQRNGDHAVACTLFGQLLADCKEEHLRHLLQFPLAKSLDSLGHYEEAFATLAAAHQSQIALLRLTAPLLVARGAPTMMITRFGCDPGDVTTWRDPAAPALEKSPVFIVAFPRSGTTLLELSLDSHPLLASMDEQPFVQSALEDIIGNGISYPERMGGLSAAQLDTVRSAYWDRARRKTALQPGQRLVDKNPLNILRLPVIRRIFPNAPIILAVRHPCDVMLSCFMQHFRTPDFALLCSDIHALAIGYRRTFDFWYEQQRVLGSVCLELRYESFTDQFQTEMRRVLKYLRLPWDDAVLRPQDRARAKGFISTPSYSQVIEPVHTKAVGHWHCYERQLAAVLPIVEPYLALWDYEGLRSSNKR